MGRGEDGLRCENFPFRRVPEVRGRDESPPRGYVDVVLASTLGDVGFADGSRPGMEHLQKATSVYSKWLSRRCDAFEDKGRSPPSALLGRTMTARGNEFEPDSDFGNALVAVGRANERVANLHSNFADDVTANWLHHVDRNVTMMRDYQVLDKHVGTCRTSVHANPCPVDGSEEA